MKKIFKVIVLVISLLILVLLLFGTVDYNRLINGKKPIFTYHLVNKKDKNKDVSTEYYGLGYVLVDCRYCTKKITVMPLYLGSYVWFIDEEYITNIEIKNSKKCDNKEKIYFEEENKNIYIYCLDEINVIKDNKKIQLSEYLKTDKEALNFILNNFVKESYSSYDDGGSKLYSGEEFNLLECNTIDGNNDIYIGNKSMGYFSGFCRGVNEKENNL